MASTLSNAQSLPTIPAGQTTVLTAEELNRIKTKLLHAEAKTKGSQILSEVREFLAAVLQMATTFILVCENRKKS